MTTSSGSAPPPLRLGLVLAEPAALPPSLPALLDAFALADELGVDVGWLVSDYVTAGSAASSPLTVLAAAGERAPRIGLGVLGLPLALQHPVHLAEDAAVLDTLTGGRLELAVTGSDERVTALRGVLTGAPLGEQALTLYPPGDELDRRVWEVVEAPSAAERAGRRPSGLVVGAGDAPALVAAYRSAFGETADARGPRIAIVRAASALDELREDPVLEAVTDVIIRLPRAARRDDLRRTIEEAVSRAAGVLGWRTDASRKVAA